MRLTGRTALVIGGSSGIGRACAQALAADGAAVVVADVDDSGGEQAVADANAAGGKAAFVHTTIMEEPSVAGASAASRRYPAARFGSAADAIAARSGCLPVFTGDTSEQALIDEARRCMSQPSVTLAGRLAVPELAALIGATRETTSTILNLFSRKEWVQLRRGAVYVPSPELLMRAADGCEQSAHL